ncbi:hypothetical protein [Nakamurella panacisegetis]|uniref:hypothetical protein n=1 Tax=Nakamurella panacisegetis TaxID=1090615 RepID=UPI000B8620AA|nr:hypothetical protein [Nakamurella panacisegetis]
MPETTAPTRRPVNVIGVIMSLVFLTVASIGLSGNPWWLLNAGAKWIVAGVIALIGLSLLVGALPGRRSRS